MNKTLSLLFLLSCMTGNVEINAQNPEVKWDAHSLIMDGKRITPVMGEIHYSRIPAEEWSTEVHKMREGGITLIATYVFWNHHEEQEGVFDWSGQRNLRRFLEVCQQEGLPVVLRLGPFCHGEVRNGGIPDWIYEKGCKVRDENKPFMTAVENLYRQIFTQVQGLQWKEGGPVLAAQFDNEYSGHGSYLLALKKMAQKIGFDLPFYTRTGWPELRSPVPYGEMLPLYGDYADGFWERGLKDTDGKYYQAFNFKAFRSSTAIASEQLKNQQEKLDEAEQAYPYFTCELGGGMMQAYHRRPYVYPEDAYSLAVVKLGSGSNLLGYYMYHGGTNPEGRFSYLNEYQRTPGVNYNDMPLKNYDFQAPLGEFGQRYPHYYQLRKLHLFMQDYGERLAPMTATFVSPQNLQKGEDKQLRWSYRSLGDSGFVFINNYERLQNLTTKRGVRIQVCGVKFPTLTIPANTTCVFPVNIDGIRYATAQLIAHRDGKIYLEQIKGIPTEIAVGSKVLRNLKPGGVEKPVYKNIYLLDSFTASRLFLEEEQPVTEKQVDYQKVKEAAPSRHITFGVREVAEAPTDDDFEQAACYTIPVPEQREGSLMKIVYRGDCARLYANGKLVADNFYYGRPFLMGLWRLPKNCKQLELRILPIQKEMPVYFPREADVREGEEVLSVTTQTVQ